MVLSNAGLSDYLRRLARAERAEEGTEHIAFSSMPLEDAPTILDERLELTPGLAPAPLLIVTQRNWARTVAIALGVLLATGLGVVLGIRISQQWFELFGRAW
jgi:hypothetical protein